MGIFTNREEYSLMNQEVKMISISSFCTGVGRWFSAALSTSSELLYNEGRFQEALQLADLAWEADPGWQRNLDLVIEINRAQSYAQEDH